MPTKHSEWFCIEAFEKLWDWIDVGLNAGTLKIKENTMKIITYIFCIVNALLTVANFQTVQPVNVLRMAIVVKGTANTTIVSQ